MNCPALDHVHRELARLPEVAPRGEGLATLHALAVCQVTMSSASWVLSAHGWHHGSLVNLSDLRLLTSAARRFHS